MYQAASGLYMAYFDNLYKTTIPNYVLVNFQTDIKG